MRAASFKAVAHSLSTMTLADLRRALDEKERTLRELVVRRDRLADEIAELGETLHAMLAGSTAAPGRKAAAAPNAETPTRALAQKGAKQRRSKSAASGERSGASREASLPVVIRSVLERVIGPMRVSEIADAVVQAGYASKSKNLAIIVANRLAQMDDIEKVERGLYQLRRESPQAVEPVAARAETGASA